MLMPGRKFTQVGKEYRYSINGQEKEKELNENITTALYWEYDSRIGRRWNVDPVIKEEESPYSTFGGNPVWFKDPFGNDTTRYYNNSGSLLMLVGNGKEGYNRAMVVKDNKVKAIQEYANKYKAELNSKSGVTNNVAVDNSLKSYGDLYDLKSFTKFYDDNSKNRATSIDGTSLKGATDFKIDGKAANPSKVKSEVLANLILKNGIVTLGINKPYVFGDATGGDADASGDEPGKVSNIHLHPYSTTVKIDFWVGTQIKQGHYFTIYGGLPSPGDHSQASSRDKGYRFVMVDNKNVVLYNGDASQNIIIKR